jgi:signal transduction histidine kinase
LFAAPNRQPLFGRAQDSIEVETARSVGLGQGLAVPLESDTGTGTLFLERINGLCADYLELGELLAAEIVNRMRRHDLFEAVEASAEARARLGLARDLHDSIVQFLAGAAFRIEALMRRSTAGEDVSDELRELKRLMLDEQVDLRAFIEALRRGREVELHALVAELDALAGKLGHQWKIVCRLTAETTPRSVPARLLIDAQQLVRESVANAVRHGKATSVDIAISADDEHLCLRLVDDGTGLPPSSGGELGQGPEPRSLKERVTVAGGELQFQPMAGGTRLTISLPIGRAA